MSHSVNQETPVNFTDECFVPNADRDVPPCELMAKAMREYIERQRWEPLFGDLQAEIDAMDEIVAELRAMLPERLR